VIKIGLDLAYRSCGIAIQTETTLSYTSKDLSKEKYHCSLIVSHMADWVLSEIQPYISRTHVLVMEDIFKGKWDNLKQMARSQGAVMDRYVQKTGQCPELVSAINARNKANISPRAPKVAIQLWAIDTFKLGNRIDKEYRNKIDETVATYLDLLGTKSKTGKKRLKELEKELNKQTLTVAEITGLDNHAADAIVLAFGATA
jgi:hypothetical protein